MSSYELYNSWAGLRFYDAYGEMRNAYVLNHNYGTPSHSGPRVLDAVGFGGQWGYYTDYASQEANFGNDGSRVSPLESTFGLLLLGHRFYDPLYARFLSRDPIGYEGGINLYAYCGNNPIMGIDPSGLDAWWNLEFDAGVVSRGLTTGLSITADTLSFGAYSSPHKNDPGARVSGNLALIGREALVSLATGAAISRAGKAISAVRAARIAAKSQKLIAQLAAQGIKHTPQNILAIGKLASGKVVFLEIGKAGERGSGLIHILERHADELTQIGLKAKEIPGYILQAVTKGKIIGYQGRGVERPIYEFLYNGVIRRLAVTIGSNGYIVGANPP